MLRKLRKLALPKGYELVLHFPNPFHKFTFPRQYVKLRERIFKRHIILVCITKFPHKGVYVCIASRTKFPVSGTPILRNATCQQCMTMRHSSYILNNGACTVQCTVYNGILHTNLKTSYRWNNNLSYSSLFLTVQAFIFLQVRVPTVQYY